MSYLKKILLNILISFFLAFPLMTFSQHLSQQEDSKVNDRQNTILFFTGAMHWWEQNWPRFKQNCDYHRQFGAPPISKSTMDLFQNKIPKAKRDLQACVVRYSGKPFSEAELDSQKESLFGEYGGLVNLLLSSDSVAPTKKNQLDSCDGTSMWASLYFESFVSASGYPGEGWCDRLQKNK
jgi:hypothetical protein